MIGSWKLTVRGVDRDTKGENQEDRKWEIWTYCTFSNMVIGLVIHDLEIRAAFLTFLLQCAFCTVFHVECLSWYQEHLLSCFLLCWNSNCSEAAKRSKGGQGQEINGVGERGEEREWIGNWKLENQCSNHSLNKYWVTTVSCAVLGTGDRVWSCLGSRCSSDERR